MSKYFSLSLVIVALVITLWLPVSAWTGPPPGTPPVCDPSFPGCNPPINIGLLDQARGGNLTINPGGLITNGLVSTAGAILQGVTDGFNLLTFQTDRPWSFQNEGSGAAAALRLRNVSGGNKDFFLDTRGRMIFRDNLGANPSIILNALSGQIQAGPTPTLVAGQVPKVLINNTVTSNTYDQGLFVKNAGAGWSILGTGPYAIRAQGDGSPTGVAFQADSGKIRLRSTNFARGANQIFVSEDTEGSGVWKYPSEIPGLSTGGGFWSAVSGNANNIYNTNSGSVGIGTTNPNSLTKLDVAGTVRSTGLVVNGPAVIAGQVQINDGTAGANKILASANSTGNSSWQSINTVLGVSGTKCPTGQVLNGINPDGTLNCVSGYGSTGTGVTQIIAGTNVTISPSTGTGAVTINSTGGSSGLANFSCPSGQFINAFDANGKPICSIPIAVNTGMQGAYTATYIAGNSGYIGACVVSPTPPVLPALPNIPCDKNNPIVSPIACVSTGLFGFGTPQLSCPANFHVGQASEVPVYGQVTYYNSLTGQCTNSTVMMTSDKVTYSCFPN